MSMSDWRRATNYRRLVAVLLALGVGAVVIVSAVFASVEVDAVVPWVMYPPPVYWAMRVFEVIASIGLAGVGAFGAAIGALRVMNDEPRQGNW